MISPRIHGPVDYLISAILALGFPLSGLAGGGPAEAVPQLLGNALLLLCVLTDYEPSLVKLVPLPVHSAVEGAAGALLAASPWLFGFSTAIWLPHVLVGLAMMGLATAALGARALPAGVLRHARPKPPADRATAAISGAEKGLSPMTAPHLSRRTVLVVEDDYFLAEHLSDVLRSEGAIILGPAGSLAEAMDLATHPDLDAALLDVNLRQSTVEPLVDVLLRRAVPFLLVTGRDPATMPLPLHGLPLMNKPIDERAMVRHLQDAGRAGAA